MPLVKCPDCGNAISPSAPTCPHCGRPQSPVTADEPGTPPAEVKKKVSPAIVAVAIGVIVWLFFYAANRSPGDAPSSTLTIERGPKQDKFCDVVQSFIRDYREAEKSGANEAGLSQLRYNRKQSLSAIMNAGEVAGWTGAVKRVTTDRDGTGRLAVQLSCGLELRSDVELYSKEGIAQGTALYATLISLTPGSKIIIAGTFEITRNGTDYIGERSLTEAGSMTNPEFNFAFESFSPAMDQDSSTAPASASAEHATPPTEQLPSTIGVPSSVWDAARSSMPSASTTSKRLPLPPDTTTDCDGPFYAAYQGTSDFGPICRSEIATAHAALRKAKLPCDALVSEWRDEPAESPMEKLECFVADNSTYGSSPVFYETGRGPFKGVTQDQWLHDLKCARGVHIPPGSPEYAEAAASCDPNTLDSNGIANSPQDQKQSFVQAPVHSAPALGNTSPPIVPSGELVKPSPAHDFPNPSDYYPAESIRMREAGAPVVHVCVGPDGEATDEPTIVRSSGSARLDEGALQLAKAGHYNPGTEDAKPVTACINMAVNFRLRN